MNYHTECKVTSIEEVAGRVEIEVEGQDTAVFMAAVIATNAYSPLVSKFYSQRKLLEPFAGQIIVSKPMQKPFQVTYPHSFDHGYEYSLMTVDGRLLIGGWRNNVEGGEIGSYDLEPREDVNQGLREFVQRHYNFSETLEWEYSWKGIMAASKTGLPIIGPTSSPLIFCCTNFTGHGMSWGCGSAKILADIMMGNGISNVAARFLSPNKI